LYKEASGSGLPRGSFDEAVALQGLDHIVNRGRGNPEIALQVRLRSLAVDLGVVVDVGQILTLFRRKSRRHGRIKFGRRIDAYLEGVIARSLEDADVQDVNLSADHRSDGLLGAIRVRAPSICANALCRPFLRSVSNE
jgi:hypothetical protein